MVHKQLDLHEIPNTACQKCERRIRHQNTEDGLCTLAPSVIDGGPTRCVGGWSRQKIYFLTQYFGIFGQGMKDKWDHRIHYIEICSGPGRCVDRDSATEFDGTALAIMGHPSFPHLNSATFVDYSEPVVEALNARIARHGLDSTARAFECDYRDADRLIGLLSKRISSGLSLVFIDPTDCSVPFATVKAIAHSLSNADLIINVALGTDATRNIKPAILNEDSRAREKYAGFLGGDSFFRDPLVVELAAAGRDEQLRLKFREQYRASLGGLGYRHFAVEQVEHFYDLLFACRHEKGLEFWKKAQKYKPDNQGTFDSLL